MVIVKSVQATLPILAAFLVLSVLSGCSGLKSVEPSPPPVVEAPALVPPPYAAPTELGAKDRLVRVIKLLEEGNVEHARIDLSAYLAQNENSKIGKSLLDQIDRAPEEFLGAQNFIYEVKANESLSQLAERFLGDRYKFWALARYNGITNPMKLTQGQKLKIPGVSAPVPEPVKAQLGDDEEIARRLAEESAEKKEPAKAEPPVKPVSIIDPIRAMALRKIGLENLQRGKIDAAIAMLKQAIDLALGTPSFAVIQKDLARALRLQASVKR
jgi:tetratricopeptide (TPR) repeat protein